eukprot:Skav228644  [mRNA]  locus=scaffold1659:30216:31898:- [translate_table: standard]
MAQRSYYQILEVDRTATLEEIRLAFKKRALQVHPDKGGSKEAFHLVYEALEALADPAARQSYDRGLVRCTVRATASARRHPKPRREAKPKAKSATKQKPEVPRTPKVPKPSPETQPSEGTYPFLSKIRDLLKCLPREMRNDVITRHFSQKQRLILEKWMVDASSQYRAEIIVDAMSMRTKRCDLQTALEFLVILTSTKQRMQNWTNMSTTFEERLEKALALSASEQGRSLAELGVRFKVVMKAGVLVAPGFDLRSPATGSIEQFLKVRGILEPFRQFTMNKGGQRPGSLFSRYSPAQLCVAWQEFQSAVAAAWEASGLDSTAYLQKIRALKEASAPLRAKNLEEWELQRMILNDKNKYRPRLLREPSSKHLDKLKRLLARWRRVLKRDECLAENARRSILRKQEKVQQDRRRLEARKRKQQREE